MDILTVLVHTTPLPSAGRDLQDGGQQIPCGSCTIRCTVGELLKFLHQKANSGKSLPGNENSPGLFF